MVWLMLQVICVCVASVCCSWTPKWIKFVFVVRITTEDSYCSNRWGSIFDHGMGDRPWRWGALTANHKHQWTKMRRANTWWCATSGHSLSQLHGVEQSAINHSSYTITHYLPMRTQKDISVLFELCVDCCTTYVVMWSASVANRYILIITVHFNNNNNCSSCWAVFVSRCVHSADDAAVDRDCNEAV